MVMGSDTDVDRATAKTFIDDVHKENHGFYSTDLGQAALKDLQQTFPLHWLSG
jgi:hypothetical protein